jgi:hypothetical protein
MPRKSPTKQQSPSAVVVKTHPAPSAPARSFTIPEFCRRNPMSRNTYFTMRAQGRGPREFRPTGQPNGVVLISEEAERDWIAACEKRNAKDRARGDEVRVERKSTSQKIDAI